MIKRNCTAQTLRKYLMIALSAVLLPACGGGSQTTGAGGTVKVQGAGATFPNPLYQKWFSEYNKITPGVVFDYQSIGSGGGIKQLSERLVDFGGSDAPMRDADMEAAGAEILHIPTVLGAVVVTYNLPGVESGLKLTPEALAGIYLGTIRNWDDPQITSANPGAALPASEITVVHRTDGSGTTFVFTDYLSKISGEWKEKVGAGTSVSFPLGLGAKGNEGVTNQVKQTPNSVGYIELIYAEQNKLPYAAIRNSAGEFVTPTLNSITAAASGAGQIPEDLRVSITNPPGRGAYPISSFTYILVHKEQRDQAKGKALADFLWWATHDGERLASDMLYAPLPDEVIKKAEAKINSITYQGQPLRTAG